MSDRTVLLWVIGLTALWGIALLVLEGKLLGDKVPDNHITAVLRKAVKNLPWPWVLLALTAGFMMGHCFGN